MWVCLLLASAAASPLVISIDHAPLAEFRARNTHVDATHVEGSVGVSAWTERLCTSELLSESTPHDVGTSDSHRRVWESVVSSGTRTLVLEDDIVLSPWVHAFEREHADELDAADITLCYANMNAVLTTVDAAGVSRTSVAYPAYPTLTFAERALRRTRNTTTLHRLVHGFGMGCYWITPKGAARLLDKVFPLTTEATSVPMLPHAIMHTSVDRKLQAVYGDVDARITLPFLGYALRHTPRTILNAND